MPLKAEIRMLKQHIAQQKPIGENHVVDIVHTYFNKEVWSLLKDEWNQMSTDEKLELCAKFWVEYKVESR